MTKQNQIDELQLKVKELEVKLSAEEHARKEIYAKKKELQDKAYYLESDLLEKRKGEAGFLLTHISRLEAVKLLFSVMASASTHRQKELFANQANTVIEDQIKEIRRDLDYSFKKNEDLPF